MAYSSYYPRRRRWRRRPYWRRGRRQHFRQHHYRRRRWHRRRTSQTVRQTIPHRRKYMGVRGWEPLGNICTSDTAKSRATPYCGIESTTIPPAPDCQGSSQWHGTYGFHYFTLEGLIKRAEQRWCRFSSNWESYDYIKFTGGTFYLPPNQDLNWMFNAQQYWLSQHFVDTDKQGKSNEETWVHPGYLLHAPGTKIVWSRRLRHNTKLIKVKVKPATTWEGWIPIKSALNYVIVFWVWTWWDPERAFFDPCQEGSTCVAEPWWGKAPGDASWVDRSKYQSPPTTHSAESKSWGPFLPTKQCSGNEASAWFLYKLKFQLGGESIWSAVPRDPLVQGFIPSAPSLNGRATRDLQPGSGDPHIGHRPWSTDDVLPRELQDGLIIDEAMERLIRRAESPTGRERERGVVGHTKQRRRRPLKHLSRDRRLLRRLLELYQSHTPDAGQNKP